MSILPPFLGLVEAFLSAIEKDHSCIFPVIMLPGFYSPEGGPRGVIQKKIL
jgi:hypothetical protein